jgi:hypothetical protein
LPDTDGFAYRAHLKKNVNAPAHRGTSLRRKSYIVDVANPRSIVVSVDILQQSFRTVSA